MRIYADETHGGELHGVAPSGKSVEFAEMVPFHTDNGAIDGFWCE